MTFKEIVAETFGTQMAFGEFLGCKRITASKYFYHPDLLTIRQIRDVAKQSGLRVEEIVSAIITQVTNTEKLNA